MEENEKYVAILYEKIVYDVEKAIFIFKPIEVIHRGTIDFENNILTTKTGKEYLSMEDEVLAFSEENLCYGYPLSEVDLKEQFPDLNQEEQIKEYYDYLLETVVFGVYDKELERIKMILAPKDNLLSAEDEDWFFNFELEQNDDDCLVSISSDNIEKLIERIDLEDYDTVKNYLYNIKYIQNQIIEGNLLYEEDIQEIELSKEEKKEDFSLEKTLNDIKPIFDELNELVGLNNVKDEIEKLVKYLIFMNKTENIIDIEQPNLNMIFTGNPGTGKTTLARIISKLFYKMGYLNSDKFAEITPKELIAEYVGQTAVKTANFIKKHKGGVIFIDEAYVFSSKAQEFAQEAIVEIIKEMEKKETVFIFAGYKDEMKQFVKLNPGMTSRVGYFLHYDDYSVDELYQIFELKVKKAKLKIDSLVENKVKEIFQEVKNKKHFGNGRFVDKLFMKILLEHSVNTQNLKSKKKLITIDVKDIPDNIVETLMHESSEDIFDNQDDEFEKIIDQITNIKTDEYIEELIKRVIMEKLYDSSYDHISTITDKKLKQHAPQILEDVKKNIADDQKIKRKELNRIGF